MNGPWWFAGVIGLVGIAVGAILKWTLDTISERRKERREISSRFVADKREAYERFLHSIDRAATSRINVWTNRAVLDHDERIIVMRIQIPTPDEREEIRSFIAVEEEAANSAIQEAMDSLKAIQMISPAYIYECGYECLRQLIGGMRAGFEPIEQAFLIAARNDLGISNTGLTVRGRETNMKDGWLLRGPNDPWPSPPGKRYPLSLALRWDGNSMKLPFRSLPPS